MEYKLEFFNKNIDDSIIHGNALDVLKSLNDQLVDCIITSPPYYKQRDYFTISQIGSELTEKQYVNSLVQVFLEAKRVLKDTGTFWLNLGDKYVDNNLLGLPWRIALALKEVGWVLRSDIIWHKPNAMPSSVKNRPTIDHEYVFLFVKTQKYFYDADAIREPHITFSDKSKMSGGRNHFGVRNGTPENGKNSGNPNLHNGRWDQAFHPLGRNKRTVWSVPLSKFRDAHFAVFPEKLIEPCILAGCPVDGLVLDPFMGSGTTGIVAMKNARRFLGIDINKKYCNMAKRRLINL